MNGTLPKRNFEMGQVLLVLLIKNGEESLLSNRPPFCQPSGEHQAHRNWKDICGSAFKLSR